VREERFSVAPRWRPDEAAYDVVVVHDPQPLAVPSLAPPDGARWIWRGHIDTSQPNPDVQPGADNARVTSE
jgi:hypothetical protein